MLLGSRKEALASTSPILTRAAFSVLMLSAISELERAHKAVKHAATKEKGDRMLLTQKRKRRSVYVSIALFNAWNTAPELSVHQIQYRRLADRTPHSSPPFGASKCRKSGLEQ
jgi:hypothetical protein